MEGKVAVARTFTPSARRLGLVAAIGTVLLSVGYAVVLSAGFWSLQSPQQPIGDPWFSMMEVLIMLLMPLLVGLLVAVHAWAPAASKVFSLLALVFMSLAAGLTFSVHFVILLLSHQASIVGQPWAPLLLSFGWPSIPYALDIIAWDVFFALAVLFAAPVFAGSRLAVIVRALLVASGALALGGLAGAGMGNMQLRNIGIVGYAGVFPVAALLLAVLFKRAEPHA